MLHPRIPCIAPAAVVLLLVLASPATLAYDTYSETGSCESCHGPFRGGTYTSLADGQSWGGSLHDIHLTIVESECDVCHTSGGRSPVYLSSSNGGPGLSAISCMGCHGRTEDGTGSGTIGYGAGVRQHHFRAGQTGCVSCHGDANPANKTPAGESVLPPYYVEADPGTFPNIPGDPCNPSPALPEDFAGTTIGIENDGDLVYDEADPDCSVAGGTPGEASLAVAMLVTAHDPVAGSLTISYGPACSASDHTLEFGPLAAVSTYGYSAQDCGLGTSGTHTWSYGTGTESLFFLVVGRDGSVEGSYGTDGAGAERPEDATITTCPVPQDLSASCDP